jgi:hypothetical protein
MVASMARKKAEMRGDLKVSTKADKMVLTSADSMVHMKVAMKEEP